MSSKILVDMIRSTSLTRSIVRPSISSGKRDFFFPPFPNSFLRQFSRFLFTRSSIYIWIRILFRIERFWRSTSPLDSGLYGMVFSSLMSLAKQNSRNSSHSELVCGALSVFKKDRMPYRLKIIINSRGTYFVVIVSISITSI